MWRSVGHEQGGGLRRMNREVESMLVWGKNIPACEQSESEPLGSDTLKLQGYFISILTQALSVTHPDRRSSASI